MAVITTLILARHGEAHCNVAGIVGGDRACTGLTGRGRHQVELLAGRLHAEEPCHVLYATTRRRARESAEVLSGKLGLPVHVEPGLTGPHHGDADGRAWDEIKTAFGGRRTLIPIGRTRPGPRRGTSTLLVPARRWLTSSSVTTGSASSSPGTARPRTLPPCSSSASPPDSAPGPGSRPATRPSPAGT